MTSPTRDSHPARPSRLSWDANPRRSLVIFSAGAVIGLALAGYALFTAKGTTTRIPPPEDVALVNQRPILVSDFNAQLETQFGVPAGQASKVQRAKVFEDMIREELFVQRGLELDMASSDPDVRAALVAAVEQQVSVDATAQSPTPAQLRAFYDAHRAQYSTEGLMVVHDLVFKGAAAKATAQAAAADLRAGAEIGRYAALDSGVVKDEEFYFAAKIHLGEALFATAVGLNSGQVSDPIATRDGVHVLLMARNTRPVAEAFETAAPKLLVDYKKAVQARMDHGEMAYLRDKAVILVAPSYP